MLSQQINQLLFEYQAVLFFIVCFLGQVLGWRLWRRRIRSRTGRRLLNAVFLIFNLGWLLTVFALYQGQNSHLADATWTWVGRPSFSWQLVYVLLILPVGALVAGSAAFVSRRPLRRRTADPGRRDFLKIAGTAGSLGALSIGGYGIFRQSRPPEVRRLTLAVEGLPSALDGLTMAQISDLHLGLWASQQEVDQAVRLAAAEKPDLVFFTGDMVDRRAEFAHLYREPLRRLAGVPHGVWGILGNHDHYTGQPALVADILTASGMTMLVDRQMNLPGLPLTLVGLDDRGPAHSWMGNGPGIKQVDPDQLDFRNLAGPEPRPGDFTIFLNHRPEGFGQAARRGYQLYLAGHTHGGQYQDPWNDQRNLAAFFYKYTGGLYHEHGAWLHVSRGVAAVGIPFRLFAWPEINILKLTR